MTPVRLESDIIPSYFQPCSLETRLLQSMLGKESRGKQTSGPNHGELVPYTSKFEFAVASAVGLLQISAMGAER